MARAAVSTSNGTNNDMKRDFDKHAGRIRKDISALASSISAAGTTLAEDAKSSAGAKAAEIKETSDQTIRELRAQLEHLESQIGSKVRERPLTSLAIAAGAGFLIALLSRR